MEMIGNIANVITTITTLVMTGIAWFALHTWRKEFIGKKKIDLACQIMESVCNIRDLLVFVRSGGWTTLEYADMLKDLQEAKAEFNEGVEIYQNKMQYLLPLHRLNKSIEQINAFLALQNKAQLYWDDNIEKLFDELHTYLHKVKNASKTLYNSLEPEKNQKLLNIIWDDMRNDDISKRVKDIVAEFRLNLEPLYKDQRTVWKKL